MITDIKKLTVKYNGKIVGYPLGKITCTTVFSGVV